ncbi:transcription-repair coupling factor [Alkaliphilus hydrothermalis]|uniref:Transcription-repair-coupling factor n=1 Tax=Alkaliphilus hydrothermalis TaxID=1482730 RepID=A0ABS2NPJ1_9FIRM|nr:transcription-repair coupling factor [Alkaliphilus hydrothermalis]MBM7614781.1 transcription-repair coupling factor (superfamily II helicase) [Alkaliphilus hydrothermalis]
MKNLLLAPLKNSIQYNQVIGAIKSKKTPVFLHGLSDSQKSNMAYALQQGMEKPICILTYSEMEAQEIYQDLKFYVDEVLYFPTKDVVFYDLEVVGEEMENLRMKTIELLSRGGNQIIVSSIEALLLKMTPRSTYEKYKQEFEVGKTIDLNHVLETFIIQGYNRVDRVEARGEFSQRGGIIDIFPPSAEVPYRIELFDDEVDSIRTFHVETQKSIDKKKKVQINPVTEAIIDPDRVADGIKLIRQELEKNIVKLQGEARDRLQEKMAEVLEKFETHNFFKGSDRFLPYIYKDGATLLDYLKPDTLFIIDEPRRIKEKVEGYTEEFRENFKTLLERGEVLPTQGKTLVLYDELLKKIQSKPSVVLNLLPKYTPDFQPRETVSFTSRGVQSFQGKFDLLVEELKNLQYKGYKVVLVPGTKERALRLLELMKERGIKANFIVDMQQELVSGQVAILQGSVHKGFEYVDMKYMMITDNEIYGVHKKKKQKTKRKDAAPIKSFIELKEGDYVVHEGHGIGKYIGIEELKVDGIKKDYLKIRYSGEDNLYVPTDQMDLIQKYIGNDEKQPKLSKLGGTEWTKTKAKVKKAIEDMAEDLLKLYAEREKLKGHTFPSDTEWQKQFEDLFPFEETPDQLRCIEEIKGDMERERPMDRLLCGDVGYGKTEVAIRSAFKAVMDNKQVAVLVPTTILAQQHFNTFKQRFSGFPIKVEMLSRFKSPAQQKKILEDARTGNIDVVIGTHRILSKDLAFKDLGLLIVDEEQRFGVKHKESLKQLKKSIDVLTLTATPIPRTLHMSMIGVRDMSVIEDPPEERYPIQTYVMAYNEALLADAITKEISRGGQIYYVYNRVQGIHQMAARIQEMVPEARIAVGHGQMSERELENLMLAYYEGEYDLLVCTTIIETGLDIPNVNTIVIHDADKLGLSQLYQLRGRVGRSNRQAYAYLMYEKNKSLTEVAEKRLKAIKEFTEFGSGFKIAMRDLEIRGAGNLLGGEQSGHMASIGYDLYVKLLEETIGEMKGEVVEKYQDTTIELNVNAYIPESYISNQSQKIEIYKKIASIRNQKDLFNVEEEVEDRFGNIPASVANLLMISYVKALAKGLMIQSISQKEKEIRITFQNSSRLKPEGIGDVLHTFGRKITFHASNEPYFVYKITTMDQYKILTDLKDIVEKISGLQNPRN